jgi:hypothetical protein
MVKEKAPEKRILVVQMEMFFNINEDDISEIAEAVHDSLEKMREFGGARVIGSYAGIDTAEFRSRLVDSIEIPTTTKLLVDRG